MLAMVNEGALGKEFGIWEQTDLGLNSGFTICKLYDLEQVT